MEVFIIDSEDINGRLDCFYYRPEYTQLESKLKAHTDRILGDYVLSIAGGATPEKDESEKYYADSGIPFLRVQNVTSEGLNLSEVKYINDITHNTLLKRSQVKEYNLLTKITGVGRMAVSAVAPKGFEGNINQHLVVIKTKDKETSETLAAFLNSDIGEKLASRRSTGGTRPALDYQALKSIPIVYKPQIVQVMQSALERKHQKEQDAQALHDSIEEYVLTELGIQIPEVEDNNCFIVFKDNLKGRFDPFSHKPEFTDFYKYLAQIRSVDFVKFGSIIQSIINGLDYRIFTDEGINYLRVSNIKPNGIDFSEVEKIVVPDAAKNIDLLRGDILLTRKGTFGVATVLDADLTDVISSEVFRIRLRDQDIIPNYVGIILNSSLCQKQFLSKKVGAIMGSLTQEAVKEILIPIPSIDIQNKIVVEVENRMVQAKKLQQEAQEGLEEAKRQVESLLLPS